MINKRDVWDITPDNLKLELFPVVVQAMYNALVTMSAMDSDRVNVTDSEIRQTLWDLRNVNKALYSVGVRPTYGKRVNDNDEVEMKHISSGPVETMCSEYAETIKERMAAWDAEQHDEKSDKIDKLQKKLQLCKLRLHVWKKYGHDLDDPNDRNESDE